MSDRCLVGVQLSTFSCAVLKCFDYLLVVNLRMKELLAAFQIRKCDMFCKVISNPSLLLLFPFQHLLIS